MTKEEVLKEKVKLLIEIEMTEVMELIMTSKDYETQRKAGMVQLANQALHHLRLLRGALET